MDIFAAVLDFARNFFEVRAVLDQAGVLFSKKANSLILTVRFECFDRPAGFDNHGPVELSLNTPASIVPVED